MNFSNDLIHKLLDTSIQNAKAQATGDEWVLLALNTWPLETLLLKIEEVDRVSALAKAPDELIEQLGNLHKPKSGQGIFLKQWERLECYCRLCVVDFMVGESVDILREGYYQHPSCSAANANSELEVGENEKFRVMDPHAIWESLDHEKIYPEDLEKYQSYTVFKVPRIQTYGGGMVWVTKEGYEEAEKHFDNVGVVDELDTDKQNLDIGKKKEINKQP
jgi:hypothetical protein